MQLQRVVSEALRASGHAFDLRGPDLGDVEVTGITMDSRNVEAGACFACVPGATADGHDFAAGAVGRGAVALLCQRPLDLPVPQIVVPSVRKVIGEVAAVIYGRPASKLKMVGVTGTNGKTTTTAMVAALGEAAGLRSAALGTLTQARTTPEAPELQARLASLVEQGYGLVAMEVSSHALDQGRVGGTTFDVGVWTNLTQDHLDYHGTMERYFQAKALLFAPGVCRHAVINGDDAYGRRLLAEHDFGGTDVTLFGFGDVNNVMMSSTGSTFRWEGTDLRVHLPGRFNISNALAAATAGRLLGFSSEQIAGGLDGLARVPGRFETVDAGQDFAVIVDYSHTPDSLAQALDAARELVGEHRVITVFGAGGDRDHDKRPMMGRAVAERADFAVVTSDNPRGEDPEEIMDAVFEGVDAEALGRFRRVADREEAIGLALALAGPGDLVMIAGKGHERGQEIAGQVRPFDDVEVTRLAIARILATRGLR